MRYNELSETKPVGQSKKTLAKFIANIQKQLIVGLKAMRTYNNISPRHSPIGLMEIVRNTREFALLLKKVEKFMVTEAVDANVMKAFNELDEYAKLVKRQAELLKRNIVNIEDEKIAKILGLVLQSLEKLAESLATFTKKTSEYLDNAGKPKKKKKKGILDFLD